MGILSGIWSFFVGGGWKWMMILSVISFITYFAREVYTDYQALITSNIELAESNGELTSVAATNTATIEEMERQFQLNEANRRNLEIQLRAARDRVDNLESLLSNHNLEFLALKKPGLIERRINDATKRTFRSIECSTGGLCPSDVEDTSTD